VDSQDVELAEVLCNLENSGGVDTDSVLGSQICQQVQETADDCDDEDTQDLSQPLGAVEDWNIDDGCQKGNVNRYMFSALQGKSHTCLV
jgi:hypothetical protein